MQVADRSSVGLFLGALFQSADGLIELRAKSGDAIVARKFVKPENI